MEEPMRYTHYTRHILIGSALLSSVAILSVGVDRRIAIQKLTEAIKAHTIAPADARKKALSFKLTGSDLKDQVVGELITTADSNGIPDILNAAKAATSKPMAPIPAIKPSAPQKTGAPATNPQPARTPELQSVSKVVQSSTPLAGPKPELIVPARLPDATFNALKEKLELLKKNHKTMSAQEIEKAVQEIKNSFGTVPIPKEMTTILTRIEAFKKQLTDDIAAMNALSAQFMEQGLKNKLTDPKVIKQLPLSMKEAQEKINAIRAHYKLNKSIQTAAANALRSVQNGLYKLIQESMKQAAQLNDNALLFKLIKKYAAIASHSEKQLELWLQLKREQELKTEKAAIEKLAKEKKNVVIQKQIKEEEQRISKELDALLAKHSEMFQREEQNTKILSDLITNDHYMMIHPEEAEKQLNLVDGNLTTTQYELYDKISDYLDSIYDDIVFIFGVENTISGAEGLIAYKHLDAHKAGEQLIELEDELTLCKGRLKTVKPHSWLAQEFADKIKSLESTAKVVQEIWYEFEMSSAQQQALEDNDLDALTQTTDTAPAAVTTPKPNQSSKETDFEAAVKKARELIAHPADASTEAEIEAHVTDIGKQAKELQTLLDEYNQKNQDAITQHKIATLKSLIIKLDKLSEKLDEEVYGIKEPTKNEFDAALKNTIQLTLKNPIDVDPWRKQFEQLNKFRMFYEQQLSTAQKDRNQPKIEQAQKKLEELRPFIKELGDKIVELEGPQHIVTPALQYLRKDL